MDTVYQRISKENIDGLKEDIAIFYNALGRVQHRNSPQRLEVLFTYYISKLKVDVLSEEPDIKENTPWPVRKHTKGKTLTFKTKFKYLFKTSTVEDLVYYGKLHLSNEYSYNLDSVITYIREAFRTKYGSFPQTKTLRLDTMDMGRVRMLFTERECKL